MKIKRAFCFLDKQSVPEHVQATFYPTRLLARTAQHQVLGVKVQVFCTAAGTMFLGDSEGISTIWIAANFEAAAWHGAGCHQPPRRAVVSAPRQNGPPLRFSPNLEVVTKLTTLFMDSSNLRNQFRIRTITRPTEPSQDRATRLGEDPHEKRAQCHNTCSVEGTQED